MKAALEMRVLRSDELRTPFNHAQCTAHIPLRTSNLIKGILIHSSSSGALRNTGHYYHEQPW